MLIAILELLLALFENSISIDISHTNSIKTIISKKNDIIIIGNSLTREGINKDYFREKLITVTNSDLKIGYIYPDDTSIIEWYYILKSSFDEYQNTPNHLMINFAKDQLRTPIIEFEEIQRIANYLRFDQLKYFIIKEDFSFSEIIDVYLSKTFRIFRHKERIAKRVLDIIPGYRQTIRKLNQSIKPNSELGLNLPYKHLIDITKLVDSLGINTTFFAMPLPNEYQINERVKSIINQSAQCNLINMQDDSLYIDKYFDDGYHLNHKGSNIFTKYLVKEIK